MDDVISTKALTSEKFIKEIERLVINYDLDYMDAVVHYCEKNNIEIEAAASIIRNNIRIKAKLQDEAEVRCSNVLYFHYQTAVIT